VNLKKKQFIETRCIFWFCQHFFVKRAKKKNISNFIKRGSSFFSPNFFILTQNEKVYSKLPPQHGVFIDWGGNLCALSREKHHASQEVQLFSTYKGCHWGFSQIPFNVPQRLKHKIAKMK
jgi:hypothetical protein